jgi:hypothetical protein
VTTLDSTRAERTHRWPDALPGSEWVIFTIGSEKSPGDYEQAEIGAVSLRTGERRLLLEGASMARWCEPGYLVFSRHGSLFAARMDAKDPRVVGEPFPLLDRVDREPSSGAVHFAISRTGTMVFAPRLEGADLVSLVWVDHAGNVTKLDAPPREYLAPRITPDGRSIIVTIGPGFGAGDLWRYDIARKTLTRLTFDGKSLVGYVTPDMREMIYTTEDADNHIVAQPLEGNAKPRIIHTTNEPTSLAGLSPDGRWVFSSPWGTRESDVLMIPVDGSGPPRAIITEPMDQADGTLTPDMRWIAYASRQAGVIDVFVRTFPPGTGRWQVSNGNAMMPRWSPTRHELYWVSGPSMYAVDYDASGNSISFGTPRKLFDLPSGRQTDVDYAPYDIAPDGSAFLMTQIANPEFARRRIDVVIDFPRKIRGLEEKGTTR